jgi:hypothetical protein
VYIATIAYLIVATAVAWLGIVLVGLGGFFFVTVAALMGTLKLAGIIAWPWSWTLLPLWGVLGIVVGKLRMAANCIGLRAP